MIAEITLTLALVTVLAGGGLMVWSMRTKPKQEPPQMQPQVREDIQKLEKEVFAKADQVVKIVEDTQEILFPMGQAEEPVNPNDTAMMRAVSEKVSKIKRRAGI